MPRNTLGRHAYDAKSVKVEMFSPEDGHRAGIGSKGWFVDLEIEYDRPLAATGFTAEQLTGRECTTTPRRFRARSRPARTTVFPA